MMSKFSTRLTIVGACIAVTAGLMASMAGAAGAAVNAVTPSTNDINKTNGWANVEQVSKGSAPPSFSSSTRAFVSCFEYRTDGDTGQSTGANYNTDVLDGLYPYECVNNSPERSPSLRMSTSRFAWSSVPRRDERFDWTRFDVLPPVCTFTPGVLTMTLDADCETDTTIKVPNGVTLDGNGHTITAVDGPSGSSFTGAVVENDGAAMHVKNLTIEGGVPNNCVGVFNGVAFMHASGSIKDVTLNNIGQTTGCQSGRAILVNAIGDTTKRSVAIENNTVTSYNKNGIDVRGNVDAKIVGNTVTGNGPISYIAQNGIVLIGASALIEGNVISGNSYLPTDVVSYGILVIDATGVKKKQNTLSGNEADFGNFGRGGGKTNA